MGRTCMCPYQQTMDLLGRRHTLTLIWTLQQEAPRRFNELKGLLGVNPVTLSQRLTELEKQGIVHRQSYNETPPRVEYRLTLKGEDLIPVMRQLCVWAEKHQPPAEETAPVPT